MQFFVCVGSPGDVPAFRQAMRDGRLTVSDSYGDWEEALAAKAGGPADGTYLTVEALDRTAIDAAVNSSGSERRAEKIWVNGKPLFDVLLEREAPSYPA